MTQRLQKHICDAESDAFQAEGLLTGDGYRITYGPKKVDFGTVDSSRGGGQNRPYRDKWVVIGEKP